MDAIKAIKERRSVRGFQKDKQISEDKIREIVECAMYAPLAINKVSWHLTVVRNEEFLNSLCKDVIAQLGINPSEHIKKRLSMPGYSPFYNAPTVIFVTGDKENSYTGNNSGAAIQNMLLAAKAMEIDSCWIGLANEFLRSEDGKKYMEKLNTSQNYEIIGAVALGYAENETVMPNKHFDEIEEIVRYMD